MSETIGLRCQGNHADLKMAIRPWDETKRRLGNYLKTSDGTM